MTDCNVTSASPQCAPSAGYSYCINRTGLMPAFTVVSASHADMENLADYGLNPEGYANTREEGDAIADYLNATQGEDYFFWVLSHEELLAL